MSEKEECPDKNARKKENNMPKGTKVHKCYTKLKAKGYSEGSAARICQKSTGQYLKTGKKPKGK